MKAIVVSEKDWKTLCDKLLDQLKLENLRHKGKDIETHELHRVFHYHIVGFMRSVEDQ